MGILKEAGVDPPSPTEAPAETTPAVEPQGKSNLWKEMAGVFTDAAQRRAFIAFIRNGFRS